MAEAEVGDDVFGDDPTVKRLEARTAELLGKEAAVFVPSGTMANQIGIGVNTQPGRRAALQRDVARLRLGGRRHRPAFGRDGAARSRETAACCRSTTCATRSGPPTTCTTSGPGWSAWRTPIIAAAAEFTRSTSIAEIARWAREHDLAMHLDGARLMNAVVASGQPAHEWAQHFDTVSICFSKGLGARSARPWPDRPTRSAGAAAAQAVRRRDAAGRNHRRRRPLRARTSRRSPGRRSCPRPVPGGGIRRHRRLRARIRPGRDQPGLGRRRSLGGDRRRGGRLSALARNPGQRARRPGASGLHAPRCDVASRSNTPPRSSARSSRP